MPLVLFAYFAVEVLAFIGVAKWIGIGWALLAVLGLMAVGGLLASLSLRSALASAAHGRSSVGKLAGDSALIMVGWVLCMVPGFVSSAAGLLTIFPPTRALMRRMLTASVERQLQDFGVRVYEASPAARRSTNYGTFAVRDDAPAEVIDADELEQWYNMEHPDEKRDGQ